MLAIKEKEAPKEGGGAEVVVDALPYIDQGYDEPGVREAALAMVEEECRRYRPTKSYVEPTAELGSPFETPAIQREMERVQSRLPMEPLSMKRYELPPPGAGRLSEPAAWAESVDNSLAQLEHQATRVMNLELQLSYGGEAWRSYLRTLTALVERARAVHTDLRKQISAVNWERKRSQTASGARLRTLRRRWAQLVSDNYRLERAIVEVEARNVEARAAAEAGRLAGAGVGAGVAAAAAAAALAADLHSESEREVQRRIEDMFAD